ncbi:hypothetical protein ACRYCC_33650 [Actinomadura scrupuli]|uniref:hypothetical protein n=1 Tax=Actinomadura scrupuli TaxID=559629 RepID=UPI003D9917B5
MAGAAIGAVTVGLAGGALASGASAAATIRLQTSITPVLQSAAEGTRFAAYTVNVKSAGGTARRTRLTVTTGLPAQWSIFPTYCRLPQDQTAQGQVTPGQAVRLTCTLGEVTGSAKVTMTLQVPAGVRIPSGLGIQAVAKAANAVRPSTASAVVSLRPLAISASAPEGATPSVAGPGPAAGPAVTPGGAAAAPQRTPADSPVLSHSQARPPRSREAPMSAPLSAPGPLGPGGRGGPVQRPLMPPLVPSKSAGPGEPALAAEPWLPTMNPRAPVHAPAIPAAPIAPPPATPALALPQVPDLAQGGGTQGSGTQGDGTQGSGAQESGQVSGGQTIDGQGSGGQEGGGQVGAAQEPDDTAPMSLATGPQLPDGRWSWTRALAVVVVAEAAVLWLAASLGLWRRRLLLGQAVGNGVRNARLLRPAATLVRRAPRLRSRMAARAALMGRRIRSRGE